MDTIQDRFKTGKKFKPIELEENFSQMCTTFCRTLASRSLSSSSEKSAISPVSELRRHLGELQSAEPSATSYTLENIRNNLLISLQEKVDALMSIEPIDSSSKLGGVLYTCQVIAEYVLINAREMKGFPISLEEGNQHNLMAHVEKLGIRGSFSKEELDFLTRGKSTRQMIRYPESYAKQNAPLVLQQSSRGRARRGGKGQPQVSSRSSAPMPSRCETMQKMLEWGRSLSREQSAADDLRGFRSADAGQAKKLEEIKKFALAEVALLSSIVKKVLVSCR